MSAPVAPYRSEVRVGRDGFAQLLRAELTKFRTVRAWPITLAAAGVLMVVFAWVSANGNHVNNCTSGPSGAQTCSNKLPPAVLGPGGQPVIDTFSFVHRPLVGNGSLTVRVTSLTEAAVTGNSAGIGPNGQLRIATRPARVPWAKAGIIITDNTRPGTEYAAVMVTPNHGVRMQYNYTHDTAGLPGAASAASPRWLRLTRTGALITGYDSHDGTHWTPIGTAHLTDLGRRAQLGLFVTSPAEFQTNHFSATVATATFDRAHPTGDLPTAGWSGLVVGADPQRYPTQPLDGSTWYRQRADLISLSGSGDIAPQVAGGIPGGNGPMNSLLAGGAIALIPIIVLATLFITSEYRRGLIRTTLSASPRRGRVIAAKAVVTGSVIFIPASVATALAQLLSRHELSVGGNYMFPLSTATQVRIILGTGLLFAIAAILVLALGATFRRSAGATLTGIALFVLPFILETTLPSSISDWLFRLTPAAAFAIQSNLPRFSQVANSYTMTNGYYPLSPWMGLAVLAVYAALALAVATWLLRRRDA